jgi:hypothetical protein
MKQNRLANFKLLTTYAIKPVGWRDHVVSMRRREMPELRHTLPERARSGDINHAQNDRICYTTDTNTFITTV